MPVAEAKERVTLAEFKGWRNFFEYRNDLAKHGQRALDAQTKAEDGTTDHRAIADGMHAALSRMAGETP